MIFINLFLEFFKIGLFAIGGGMATIPFLQQLSLNTGWFPMELITDMIAISESTPGPIGINMATYVGYNIAGIAGGITATLGEILPAMIIVTLVSKSLEKFSNNRQIDNIFYGLRPAVTGLIAAAGFDVFKIML
ncbi:chromate transporter [[Clostridium] symbiosum]